MAPYAEEGCKLFVYGVNENTSNSELQEAFSKYGNVVDTYNTGKGYAFVTFDNKEDASTATDQLNGQEILGQQVKVNVARPKEGGGGGGGGYGGGGGGGDQGGGGGGGGGGRGGGGPSVFVGNIPWSADENQLSDLFAQYGSVQGFRLLQDRETGRPRGMGFCEFGSKEECQAAIDGLNGHDLDGRELRVDHAKPRQ